MECTNCGNEVEEFFSEEIECHSCHDLIVIGYYHCKECNTTWKAQDEVPIFSVNFNDAGFPEDVLELFDKVEEEMTKLEESNSMSELVHKCIGCHAICYEVADGTYKCPECDFEWEVIKCE